MVGEEEDLGGGLREAREKKGRVLVVVVVMVEGNALLCMEREGEWIVGRFVVALRNAVLVY